MATGVQVWSQTPATNATADTNITWSEGMAPSQVNDSSRAVMSSVAKWSNDNNGTIVTSGTTTAFTAVTNQVEAALTAGYTVALQFHATNDSSATLAVDGLAAKPLQLFAGTGTTGQEFQLGSIQRFTYSSTGTGQWIANGTIRPKGIATVLGPLNPTGVVGATFKMMGMGTTFTFTPTVSTKCLLTLQGNLSANAVATTTIKPVYGTGAAPANQAAASGTVFPGTTSFSFTSASANYSGCFCVVGLITGLAPGTAYWVDAQLANGGAGTASCGGVSFVAQEI